MSLKSFGQLVEEVSKEHDRLLASLRRGSVDETDEQFDELIRSLVAEHKSQIGKAKAEGQVRADRPKRGKAKETKFLPWGGEDVKFMWQLGDPTLPKKGGPEHRALEDLMNETLKHNREMDKDSEKIKAEISVH